MNVLAPVDELIRMQDVEKIVGLKRSQIYLCISQGAFPAPAKLGTASRWSRSEVGQWVAARLAERNRAA